MYTQIKFLRPLYKLTLRTAFTPDTYNLLKPFRHRCEKLDEYEWVIDENPCLNPLSFVDKDEEIIYDTPEVEQDPLVEQEKVGISTTARMSTN